MLDALKLIAAKSPVAMSEAIKTIQAYNANSPVLQQRYNLIAEMALGDPQADFSTENKTLIAGYLDVVDSEKRTCVQQIRLTKSEKQDLEQMASEAGESVSSYIRGRIFES